jgi:DnaJ-class molecular chaperone
MTTVTPKVQGRSANGEWRASAMRGSKVKEHVCPACSGSGYPVVKQSVQPGCKVYPVKCKSCDGKGKVADAT